MPAAIASWPIAVCSSPWTSPLRTPSRHACSNARILAIQANRSSGVSPFIGHLLKLQYAATRHAQVNGPAVRVADDLPDLGRTVSFRCRDRFVQAGDAEAHVRVARADRRVILPARRNVAERDQLQHDLAIADGELGQVAGEPWQPSGAGDQIAHPALK